MGQPAATVKKSTPMAIIEAAERLFGDYGIEGVSIRQIGLEAKAGNKSAVSYHFGDRADLVLAIWAHRLPVLEARRQELLAELRAEGLTGDARAIARVLTLPNYELVDGEGRRRYAAFFRSTMRWAEGRELRAREMATTPASAEAIDLLTAALPGVPADLLHYRLAYGSGAFMDMIVDRERAIHAGEPVMPEVEFLAEAMDMIAAVCSRPPVSKSADTTTA